MKTRVSPKGAFILVTVLAKIRRQLAQGEPRPACPHCNMCVASGQEVYCVSTGDGEYELAHKGCLKDDDSVIEEPSPDIILHILSKAASAAETMPPPAVAHTGPRATSMLQLAAVDEPADLKEEPVYKMRGTHLKRSRN